MQRTQEAVHRLFYIYFSCVYRFLCNLLPKLSTRCTPIVSGFSTFFSYFTKADIPNAFFWLVPSQFLLFSFEGPVKSDFIKDPYSLPNSYDRTYLCRIFMISEVTDDKNLPLLSQQCSTNRFFSAWFVCFLHVYIHGIFAGIQSSEQHLDLVHIQSQS